MEQKTKKSKTDDSVSNVALDPIKMLQEKVDATSLQLEGVLVHLQDLSNKVDLVTATVNELATKVMLLEQAQAARMKGRHSVCLFV